MRHAGGVGLLIRLAELLLILVPLAGVAYATFRAVVGARGPQVDRGSSQRNAISRAIGTHDRTDTRWLAYEIDVQKTLDYPLMTDMREPLTLAFHRARVRAEDLRPESDSAAVGTAETSMSPGDFAEYRDAVGDYAAAFEALDLAAVKKSLANPVMIDLRNLFNGTEAKAAGLEYFPLGRPA